jgi:HAD superfamily hydrolase (TIGR01509 family)
MSLTDKKAVIFDFDGLLVDSEPFWNEADTAFLAERGIPYTLELREQIRGMGLRHGIKVFQREFGLQGDIELLMSERRRRFLALFLKKPRLMPYAKEIVEAVKERYRIAIATGGNTVPTVKEILKRIGLANYFTIIVSSDEVEKGKPAPDVYLLTAKKLMVTPQECLVIEDSPNGVIAAKAAGMLTIGVNTSKDIQQKLHDAGADRVFESLKDVVRVLRKSSSSKKMI